MLKYFKFYRSALRWAGQDFLLSVLEIWNKNVSQAAFSFRGSEEEFTSELIQIVGRI